MAATRTIVCHALPSSRAADRVKSPRFRGLRPHRGILPICRLVFRLAGAAFTTLDFSVSVIAPFCSAPVALVVSTNEAALASRSPPP